YLGNSIDTNPVFLLRWMKQPEGETTPLIERVHEIAKDVLIVARRGRKMPATQVRQFLSRYRAVLKVLAREGREIELQDRLKELGGIRDACLSMVPPNSLPPARYSYLEAYDTFDGPFEVDLDDMVDAVVQSKDPPTVKALLIHLHESAYLCKEQ